MPWWMKWRLYKLSGEVSGGLFSGIWFILKWIMFWPIIITVKIGKILTPIILAMMIFTLCAPFIMLYAIISAIFNKEN
jgi:hypothetical protein